MQCSTKDRVFIYFLYVNDLNSNCTSIILYADDCALLVSYKENVAVENTTNKKLQMG